MPHSFLLKELFIEGMKLGSQHDPFPQKGQNEGHAAQWSAGLSPLPPTTVCSRSLAQQNLS